MSQIKLVEKRIGIHKLSQVVIFLWLSVIVSVEFGEFLIQHHSSSNLVTVLDSINHLIWQPVESAKCYVCGFHLAYCTSPLDCYNQPDICSNTNFSPLLSQVDECPFGCEQYIKTDATGALVLWRRGCATEGSPKSSYICYSRIIYFQRHEQCWCQADYCNSSSKIPINSYLKYVGLVIVMAIASTRLTITL